MLNVLITMHGRRPLAAVCFAYWERMIAAGLVHRVVVVATEQEDLQLINEYGFQSVQHPNEPHGSKFDAGLPAATEGADGVVLSNSCGAVGRDYLASLQDTEAEWINPQSLFVLDRTATKTPKLYRFPHLFWSGHGMYVAQSVWNRAGLTWQSGAVAGHTDHAMITRLRAGGAVETAAKRSAPLMTVKLPGNENITGVRALMDLPFDYDTIKAPWKWIADKFDTELSEDLKRVAV